MTVEEAIERMPKSTELKRDLNTTKGFDFKHIRTQEDVEAGIRSARSRLSAHLVRRRDPEPDYDPDEVYWNNAIVILEAARIVGMDNIPDPCPGKSIGFLDDGYGQDILKMAKRQAK